MYFYFYDSCTQKDEHASTLHSIEARLVELGINGRIEKLSIFKNAKDLIEDAIRKGAQTVIAVGNDSTFTQVVNVAAPYDVTIGFIPVEQSPLYGELLGMPMGPEACEIISKRRKVTMDVGVANGNHFVSSLHVEQPTRTEVVCNGDYSVTSTHEDNTMNVANINTMGMHTSDYEDAMLEVIVEPGSPKKRNKKRKLESTGQRSVFKSDSIEIATTGGEEVTCSIDNTLTVHTPCTVGIMPKAISIIVGKERSLTLVNKG